MVIPLFSIIVVLAVVGLLLWALPKLPIDAQIVQIIRVVAIVAACLWILSLFFGGVPGVRFR